MSSALWLGGAADLGAAGGSSHGHGGSPLPPGELDRQAALPPDLHHSLEELPPPTAHNPSTIHTLTADQTRSRCVFKGYSASGERSSSPVLVEKR